MGVHTSASEVALKRLVLQGQRRTAPRGGVWNGGPPQNLLSGVGILGLSLLEFYIYESFFKCVFKIFFFWYICFLILPNVGIRDKLVS